MKNLIAGQEKVLSWIVKVHTILIGGVHLYFDFTIAPDVGTLFFFFFKQGTSSENFFVEKKEILIRYSLSDNCDEDLVFYFLFNIICHIEMMGENERLPLCNDALLQS